MLQEVTVDLSDPAGAVDSLVALARDSATGIDAVTGGVIALRYREIDQLARDRRLAGVGLSAFDMMGIEGPLRDWYSELMFTNEGDAHARMRRLVSRAFTPRAAEQLRFYARTLICTSLDKLEADGGGDLVVEFSRLGTRVMCRLLGVPDEDVDVFGAWADALSPIFGFMDEDQIRVAESALDSLLSYTSDLVRRRHGDPADDLISALLAAEHEGDRLNRHEVVTMVANLLVAAHDTTASQLGCSLLALLRHPEAAPPIRSGRVAPSDALSETMRVEPAIPLFPRTLLEPVEIGGAERPAGTLVLLAVAAANRDPDVYSEPNRFIIDRFCATDVPRPLSFGTGPHFCLGSNLARMIMEEAIAGFAGRKLRPGFDPGRVTWRLVLGRGPTALPVEVGAGR